MVGQKWDQLKRSDSSEILQVTPGRRKQWSPLHKQTTPPNDGVSPKRMSRVESLKSLLGSDGEESRFDKLSKAELRKIYDMYKNVNDSPQNERPTKSRRRVKSTTDNLELSQQQLLDYLMLIKPDNQELEKLFAQVSNESPKNKNRLEILNEEKNHSKPSRFKMRNIFGIRSSSKSDDESEFKPTRLLSSTGSLTSLTNFIMPHRRNSNHSPVLPNKIKSDESGYGSDSTRTTGVDSPRGSIKSQLSDLSSNDKREILPKPSTSKSCYNDDTDTAEEDDDEMIVPKKFGRSLKKFTNKKRSRSHSEDSDTFSRRKSIRLKKSPSKAEKFKVSIEDLSQACCDKLNKLKIGADFRMKPKESSNKILEREFKCVRLRLERNESIGVVISPHENGPAVTYTIANIEPKSAAEK